MQVISFSHQKNKSRIKYGKTGGTTIMPLFYQKNTKTRSVGWGAITDGTIGWVSSERTQKFLYGECQLLLIILDLEYYQSLKYEFLIHYLLTL